MTKYLMCTGYFGSGFMAAMACLQLDVGGRLFMAAVCAVLSGLLFGIGEEAGRVTESRGPG